MPGEHFIPHTAKDRREMLAKIGVKSIDELFADIPEAVRLKRPLNLPESLSELEVRDHMGKVAEKNADLGSYSCFLGAGSYDHFIPSIVNEVTGRAEFYTAYTPYQPEISQGYLQAIYEYQTMICELTGMDIANASMYDGGTALAEAALLASRVTRRDTILVAESVHPFYREVLKTYAAGQDVAVREIGYKADGRIDIDTLKENIDKTTAAVLVQYPNFFGVIEDLKAVGEIMDGEKGLFVVAADPISLGALQPPGSFGADIVVGEGQSLGNPPSFGGPGLGIFAAREKFARRMPGRIVGKTSDGEGNRGFVLTLQTREQHIRRERATSNICSNEALNALAATVYLAVMGKQGVYDVANLCINKAHYAYEKLTRLEGIARGFSGPFFKEFTVKLNRDPDEVNSYLLNNGIIGGYPLGSQYPELKDYMLFCVTEKRSKAEIDYLVGRLEVMV